VGLLHLVRARHFASSVVTLWAIKEAIALVHPYVLSHKLPLPPRFLSYA
jgi:hypothetical protein